MNYDRYVRLNDKEGIDSNVKITVGKKSATINVQANGIIDVIL